MKHVLVVRNGWQEFVDRLNPLKVPLGSRVTTRKNREDHNLGFGQTLTQLGNDRLNAECNIGRGVATAIVGADH